MIIEDYRKQLKALAKRRGATQLQIATNLGVSRISINRFFGGHSCLKSDDYMALLRFLDIDVAYEIKTKLDISALNARP